MSRSILKADFGALDSSFSDEHGPLKRGSVLRERYEIVRRVGSGGMGDVFEAKDLLLGERVALKFLQKGHASDQEMVDKFVDEVRIARRVAHGNVCRVFDIGDFEGYPFLSMEYVEGGSLLDVLAAGPLDLDRALRICLQLCWGLAAIHATKVIHRDLKPGNVLLDPRHNVKITDFGLAGAVAKLNAETLIVGTMPYMAPEQLRRGAVSVASDIYSLGLVMYEVFTGKAAYQGTTRKEYQTCHQFGPTPPAEVRPGISPEIQALILQCLDFYPDKRPASVEDVYLRLANYDGDFDQLALAMLRGHQPPRNVFASLDPPPRRRDPNRPTVALRKGRKTLSTVPIEGTSASAVALFDVGNAVCGDGFFGFEDELKVAMGRVRTGQSTLVVGPAKSGKSSLLKQLCYKHEKGSKPGSLSLCTYDASALAPDDSPFTFWEECLSPLAENANEEVQQALDRAAEADYRRPRLQALFRRLAKNGHGLAVLVDDINALIAHEGFRDKHFFALLRSLCINFESFSVTATTRLPRSELNKVCPPDSRTSSFFNHMVEVTLKPLSPDAVDSLLGLAATSFSTREKDAVRRLAGRHPYLVQCMASILHGMKGERRLHRAYGEFYAEAQEYLGYLWTWEGLAGRARSVLLALGMAIWAGRAEMKREVDWQEVAPEAGAPGLAQGDIHREVENLHRLGLIRRVDDDASVGEHLLWQQERWTFDMDVLSWYVWDLVMDRGRDPEAFDRWIREEEHDRLIAPQGWARLRERLISTPIAPGTFVPEMGGVPKQGP